MGISLFLSTVVGVWVLTASAYFVPQDPSVVDLGYAQYGGFLNTTTNVTNFLGVQFAAAPVGDLRWRAPRPPPRVRGVQNASTQPDMCYQAFYGVEKSNRYVKRNAELSRRDDPGVSEDCLYLNVYVPEMVNPEKRLPVVVWIHGGGYVSGNAAPYDGAQLVNEADNKVIAVVIQYRLGLFGFLAGSEVKRDGSLNAGLLDQEFALRWVHNYISKFGGDPDKVTIWGESAGAGSVLQHLVARNGINMDRLFRGAITSSIYLPPQYRYNARIPQRLYREAVLLAGCARTTDSLACLRASDAAILGDINRTLNTAAFFGTFTLVPVVDGDYIKQPIYKSLREGKTNGNALLSIDNTNEGFVFTSPKTKYSATEYARQLFPTLSRSASRVIGAIYSYGTSGSRVNQSAKIQSDSVFLCPAILLQESFRRSGKPAWKGEFAISPGYHGQDVNYYFKGLTFNNVTAPEVFTADNFDNTFVKSFSDFVVFQDPNQNIDDTDSKPFWPEYTNRRPQQMIFGETKDGDNADIRVAHIDRRLLERCRIWEALGSDTGQ